MNDSEIPSPFFLSLRSSQALTDIPLRTKTSQNCHKLSLNLTQPMNLPESIFSCSFFYRMGKIVARLLPTNTGSNFDAPTRIFGVKILVKNVCNELYDHLSTKLDCGRVLGVRKAKLNRKGPPRILLASMDIFFSSIPTLSPYYPRASSLHLLLLRRVILCFEDRRLAL